MSRIVEFHILQSTPVACLNRDDAGSPKTALIGGTVRARVSSQCFKRAVRLAMHDLGVQMGMRTKKIKELLVSRLEAAGCEAEKAEACGAKIAGVFADDTLLFVTDSELDQLAAYAAQIEYDADKVSEKELAKMGKKFNKTPLEGLDIALFGRMVAKAPTMNVEAAASFAHAISTHTAAPEMDFFTAVDDQPSVQGSAHMGILEFSSATYYRYISLNIDKLIDTLGLEDMADVDKAIEAFMKALYIAMPGARQTTMSAAMPWDYARVLVRNGQRAQLSFETPVRAERNGGYLEPSRQALNAQLEKQEKQFGSLYGKIGSFEIGTDDGCESIDALIAEVCKAVRG